MNYKTFKENINKLLLVMMMFWLLSSITGCASLGSGSAVLVDKEQYFTILKGTPFTAIQKPTYSEPTQVVVADSDLKVVYPGTLARLQEEANENAFKLVEAKKVKSLLFGGIGILLVTLVGLLGKKFAGIIADQFFNSKKKKKKKKKK